ncbi:hypothetical protein ACOMHN_023151 [Nucella lapillus]
MAAQQKRSEQDSLAPSAMTKLDTIWKSNTISLPVKIRLYKSLVISIFLCESWTLNVEIERRLQAFENKFYRKLLRIPYSEHKINEYVRQQTDILAGKQERLLSVVKHRYLAWFGHVNRHDFLAKTILQGFVEGGRRRDRQRKAWSDNAKEWTGETFNSLLRISEDRDRWRP